MGRFRNPAVVPAGMLAPAGIAEDANVNPFVQSTTRPAGSLLRPSPGFDTVRTGKNRFQGKGPTGGFRRMEFAEDIDGTGAMLSIEPGDTALIDASEWIPEGEDQFPEGSMIIADRHFNPGSAAAKHEANHTLPDMGDRSPGRPLSKFLRNPAGMLREDYQENRVVAVLAAAGVVTLAWIIGNDLEREYRGRSGKGVTSDAAAVPESAVAVSGNTVDDVTSKIEDAADKAVEAIKDATDEAVSTVKEVVPDNKSDE